MTIDRRRVLAAGAAFCLLPKVTGSLAAASDGEPLFVSSARRDDGSFAVVIVTASGRVVREIGLADRGHDVAISHDGERAVAFARRPGTFAVAFGLNDARPPVVFETPANRHFYGHGVFSTDNRLLYATENDYENGRGMIGVYDVAAGFRRIGEMPSHGMGPHDLLLLGDGRTLCIANGGIETHPDVGRAELNLDTMRPTLVFMDCETGNLIAEHALPAALNKLSIRHLCQDGAGRVWFGGQWQGVIADSPVLAGFAAPDRGIELVSAGAEMGAGLRGYIGSITASSDGRRIAVSSPKVGVVVHLDSETRTVVGQSRMHDCCGLAAIGQHGILVSSGDGLLRAEDSGVAQGGVHKSAVGFDNHLRRLRS